VDQDNSLAIATKAMELSKKNSEALAGIQQGVKALTDRLGAIRDPRHPSASDVFGVPHVRKGEDSMGSRGFSLIKMFGLITKQLQPDNARTEYDFHNRLHKIYNEGGGERYDYKSGHVPGDRAFLAPLAPAFFPDNYVPADFRREMKMSMQAGVDGYDPDEAVRIQSKFFEAKGYDVKTLSWLNEILGGSLVAPPEQGELIELLRNKEALVNAGARTVPLPPQGRMKYPRQTAASLTFWVGENSPITSSDIGTGEIILQAKKLTVLIKMPNELIRFANPAAEALVRDDMTKSLALGMDLAGLEGLGGDNRPLGLINRQGIQNITSSQPGPNGDRLVAEDIYRMVAAVEEGNATFESWIMRPKTWYKYLQLRADAVSQGDRQGMFLFNMIREPGESSKPTLATYPVTKSTQVSQVRSKGGSTNLTYILGGMFSDVLIGMFGAIEFSATTLGDTPFVNDQTWVKGILSADVQVRHEIGLVLMDNLDVVNQ
jgi:HK97 family phage major capsid protein